MHVYTVPASDGNRYDVTIAKHHDTHTNSDVLSELDRALKASYPHLQVVMQVAQVAMSYKGMRKRP